MYRQKKMLAMSLLLLFSLNNSGGRRQDRIQVGHELSGGNGARCYRRDK
jgi:hypothetical protein